MVGTFYVSPSAGETPFVQVGDQIKKGQVIGIVEAMKLMNEIEAEWDGTVEEILAENEQLVEFGQPLVRIRPYGK
jgi:acetyl-CoA carboxylase biotin carboxyl carrier protein